jgi:hypothetical protein
MTTERRTALRLLGLAAALCTLALLGVGAAVAKSNSVCINGGACYGTIQAAADAAHDGDTIRLGPGTYAGGVTIVHSITLQGAGSGKTAISGGGPVLTLGSYRAATEPTISIDGVTITGGVTTTSPESRDFVAEDGVFAYGGGVYVAANSDFSGGATVSISNSVIANNEATPTLTLGCTDPCTHFALAAGGGIYTSGQLTLKNTTVDDNVSGGPTASKAIGGGILSATSGRLTVENSTVSNNRVTVVDPNGVQATGAGILSESGDLLVRNSIVTGNRSELTSTKVSVDDAPFFANVAGIGCDRSATIVNTRIEENVVSVTDLQGQPAAYDSAVGCGNSGGAMTMQNSSVSRNRVVANVADTTDSGADGTAIEFDDAATVTNAVIAGNSVSVTTAGGIASAQGAVLNFAFDPGNPTTISNSVIKDNTMTATSTSGAASVQGGGIANAGALVLHNDVISGNNGTASGSGGFGQGAGIWNGSLFGSDATGLTIDRTTVTRNSLSGAAGVTLQGAGIYSDGFTATLTQSVIAHNSPDQCHGLTC